MKTKDISRISLDIYKVDTLLSIFLLFSVDKLAQQSEPRFQKPPPVDIESQDEMLPKTADARGW